MKSCSDTHATRRDITMAGTSEAENRFRYERIVARDRTCDGRFITGVHTTGIYCLPSCPARKPKPENITFFESEAQAVAAGLRPCKRCRPDLFYRGADLDVSLYQTLLTRLRDDASRVDSVVSMADLCGVSLSKLNDLARAHAHLSPAALLRRERVRLAKDLLLRSATRVIDVGFSSGFDSEATFHRQFLAGTGMTPGAYRLLGKSGGFQIQLPVAYLGADVLAYFARDAEQVSERVTGHTLCKAFMAEGGAAILSVELNPGSAHARCALHAGFTLSPADYAHAHAMASRMLGLDNDAPAFEARAAREPLIGRLVAGRFGLRPPLTANVFESLVWAIVGQQVNLAFATSLRRTVIQLAGQKVSGSDLLLHPLAARVADLDIGDLTARKFSRSKANYLIGAAQSVASDELALDALQDQSAVLAERSLLALRGIGPWSAAYVMLRGLGFGDCIPVGDSGLNEGLRRFFMLDERPDVASARALMENFAPHRSLATCHLWASLKEYA